jgi:peptide/nickel transport system substrate-binding protein
VKIMAISLGLAFVAMVALVSAFSYGDDEPQQAREPAAPPTLQPRATRPLFEPTSSPTVPGEEQPVATTLPGDALVSSAGGDRSMGKPIEQPAGRGGTLVIGVAAKPASLNPLLAGEIPAGSILNAIFEPLVEPNPDTLEPVGALAHAWSVDARGLVWTFRLRPDVRWHDGQALTAADVVFSYSMYLDPDLGHPAASEHAGIVTAVEDSGPSEVQIVTSEPFPDLPLALGSLLVVPEHIFGGVAIANLAAHPGSNGAEPAQVVGTGPFRFERIDEEGRISAVANLDYWDGAPALERLVARPVESQAEMIELLRSSEIDVGTLSPGSVTAFEGLPVQIVDAPVPGVTLLGFNLNAQETALFQDERVRRALLMALDRESMVRDARAGYGDVAPGTLPLNSYLARPDQITTRYPYDPAAARQLLDDAGWTMGPDGVRTNEGRALSFSVVTNAENEVRDDYLDLIVEQWAAIGVGVEIVIEPFEQAAARLTDSGDFEAFLMGYEWDAAPDQAALFACAGGRPAANLTGYCNESVDRLLYRARREFDPQRRAELYLEMQELVLADLPVAILDFPRAVFGVAQRAHNVYPNTVNMYFNAERWWLGS